MPDFSLLQMPNFAQSALAGYQSGRMMHQQQEREGALQGYLANPDDKVALTRLTAADPELGFPLMKQQRDEAQRKETGRLAQLAAGGDHQAAAALWQSSPEMAQHFDESHKKQLEEGMSRVAQAGLGIWRLPDDQIPAAADQAIDNLAQTYPDLAHYRGHIKTREDLRGVLETAGAGAELNKLGDPDYSVRPQGGVVIQTNPYAPGGFGVANPEGDSAPPAQNGAPPSISDRRAYDALPPGTPYIDQRTGQHKIKGGAGPAGPQTFR